MQTTVLGSLKSEQCSNIYINLTYRTKAAICVIFRRVLTGTQDRKVTETQTDYSQEKSAFMLKLRTGQRGTASAAVWKGSSESVPVLLDEGNETIC